MSVKQKQALKLLDQLTINAQVADEANPDCIIGECFQVHYLKVLKALLLEVFGEEKRARSEDSFFERECFEKNFFD